MNRNVKIYLGILIILSLSTKVFASTYVFNGNEISKGEAIVILVKDPKAKVQKIDLVGLDLDKGTLKTKAVK